MEQHDMFNDMKKNYRRLLAVFMGTIGAMSGSCKTAPYQISTERAGFVIPADHPSIRYMGRFDRSNPKRVKFGHSASRIDFRFRGDSLKVILKDDPRLPLFPNHFRVIIDSSFIYTLTLNRRETVYTLADFAGKGEHTVTLIKDTESFLGAVEFGGFLIDFESEPLDPPPLKGRKIEFIGDSITCGYGVNGASGAELFRASTESAYYSYAGITARLLDADYISVCRSGIGVARNFEKDRKKRTMPNIYHFTYLGSRDVWDFTGWNPDVVVINLGTNDFSRDPLVPPGEFYGAYTGFIKRLRLRYPDAPIVCLMGPMFDEVTELGPVDGHLRRPFPILREYMDGVMREVKAQGIENVYLFELTNDMERLGYGSNYHPGRAQQQLSGTELAGYL
jgi:hypothetical protein